MAGLLIKENYLLVDSRNRRATRHNQCCESPGKTIPTVRCGISQKCCIFCGMLCPYCNRPVGVVSIVGQKLDLIQSNFFSSWSDWWSKGWLIMDQKRSYDWRENHRFGRLTMIAGVDMRSRVWQRVCYFCRLEFSAVICQTFVRAGQKMN